MFFIMFYRQIIVVLGIIWLLWALFAGRRSDWTSLDWVFIGFVSLSVLSLGYSLIREKRG